MSNEPDGPEAATEIERLTKENEMLEGVCEHRRTRAEQAEAAITRLTARIAVLEGALEPFANFARPDAPEAIVITNGSKLAAHQLTMGACRRAREALNTREDG